MSKQQITTLKDRVNANLQKNLKEFQKLAASPKMAYNYFQDNFYEETLTYDNFFSYFRKFVPKPIGGSVSMARPMKSVMTSSVDSVDIEPAVEAPFVLKERKSTDKSNVSDADFTPMLSGKFIDKLISEDGGPTPGAIVVFAGGPSVGKTTIANNTMVHMLKMNKTLSGRLISSEYDEVDLKRDQRKKPWMKDLITVLLADYEKSQYKTCLEHVILYGHDVLVLDSFQSIVEKLNAFCYMTVQEAAKWLLDLLMKAKNGQTQNKKKPFIFLIQQVTKGGVFVGKNNLKHDTTAMFEFHFDGDTERYMIPVKNRMNPDWQFRKLYYHVDEAKEIQYDERRFMDELDIAKSAMLRAEKMRNNESVFDSLFLSGDNESPGVDEDND
jgi:hypothetical protein